MERVSITERPDWREKAHEYGFNFHTMYGEPYWCEDAYYKLTLAQVEKLEEVTAELHQMCLKVVEKVIASDELMTKFRIPKHTWSFVRQSWLTHQPSLYSRLDLAWDGTGEPKLLENNADTPTSLYEAAFFQWIDPEKIGLGLTAFVLIKTQHHSSEWYCRFVTVVTEMPEVLGFWRMAGEYDYLMRVQVADMKRYDEFYKRLVNSVPGLSDVTSSFAMEQIKYTTSLPIE